MRRWLDEPGFGILCHRLRLLYGVLLYGVEGREFRVKFSSSMPSDVRAVLGAQQSEFIPSRSIRGTFPSRIVDSGAVAQSVRAADS